MSKSKCGRCGEGPFEGVVARCGICGSNIIFILEDEQEYIIAYTLPKGTVSPFTNERLDNTSVDAKNEEEALEIAEDLKEELFPDIDAKTIKVEIVDVKPILKGELD